MTSGRSWTWNTEANVLKSVHIRQREELQWNNISEQYTYYCVYVKKYIWLYVHILHNTQIYCIHVYIQILYIHIDKKWLESSKSHNTITNKWKLRGGKWFYMESTGAPETD